MNEFVLEVCERKQYAKTMKILKQQTKTSGSLQRLDNFISYKKAKKIKMIDSKNKLSFEVSSSACDFLFI